MLLQAYAEYVRQLPLVARSRHDRHLGARRLLKRLHGLDWADASVANALDGIDKNAGYLVQHRVVGATPAQPLHLVGDRDAVVDAHGLYPPAEVPEEGGQNSDSTSRQDPVSRLAKARAQRTTF